MDQKKSQSDNLTGVGSVIEDTPPQPKINDPFLNEDKDFSSAAIPGDEPIGSLEEKMSAIDLPPAEISGKPSNLDKSEDLTDNKEFNEDGFGASSSPISLPSSSDSSTYDPPTNIPVAKEPEPDNAQSINPTDDPTKEPEPDNFYQSTGSPKESAPESDLSQNNKNTPAEDINSEENSLKKIERQHRSDEEEKIPKEIASAEPDKKYIEGKKEIELLSRNETEKHYSRVVLVGLGVGAIILAGGGIWWWLTMRNTPTKIHFECQENKCVQVDSAGTDECLIDQDCLTPVDNTPASLITVVDTQTIEIAEVSNEIILNSLKEIASQSQAETTLKRILIKLTTTQEYFSYAEALNILGVNNIFVNSPDKFILYFYDQSESNIDKYTLFFYAQPEGNRLGLVAEINSTDSVGLLSFLRASENNMLANLKSLLLDKENLQPATNSFEDNTYREIPIRYLNLPNPDTTIDYALVNNKLIITTSRASMYATIDALSLSE